MTDPSPKPDILPPAPEQDNPPDQGPSLVLLYSILAGVLLLAIFLAALIVRPFYLRR
ncbi:MAG TPA: hypothetical protein VFU68_03050 [Terracidiphilus sp.]|nr:hypothetical protein [Terracidiphilus sp.]